MKRTLEVLFLDELADMFDAESRLTKSIPKLARKATHPELREALEEHLAETEHHLGRLRKVFQAFGRRARGKKCNAIVGLAKEANEIASDNAGWPTINAALICAAQKVEHYEIASYGCLVEWARQLGNAEAASLLQQTLDEEKAADQKLTELARYGCNEAAQGEMDEEAEFSSRAGRGTRPRRGLTPAAY